ncbi:ATP synthase F1 subunit delta [Flavisolibacter nicotianae]|uniref:ATP synthase F1 subunit delta n=1 Tax=Flavisolibacter nicotianae TaxID=2364882 RepID=UPI000EB57160|nr:ATP synthase F1 subunit delta [Flavisolibacter nicotianae]
MSNPRVASRYAKSLLDLAIEKGQLEPVYADMLYLQRLTKESRDFLNLLRSPVVKADAKNRVLQQITQGKVSELTAAFINLMVNKTRESVLPEIITAFISQYRVHKGIQIVKLTTAVPVSSAVKNAILEQVKKSVDGKTVELQEVVDPKIIGGFILQAGDKLIDASISYDLLNVSRQFENNDFIYRVK